MPGIERENKPVDDEGRINAPQEAAPRAVSSKRVVLVQNPFDILRMSPNAVQGKTPEQALKLVHKIYQFWARIIHPDVLNQHKLNPINGGDVRKWEQYLGRLPDFGQIDEAYKQLKDPVKCAAAIAKFKPMTPSAKLNEARKLAENEMAKAHAVPDGLARFLMEACDSKKLSVKNCGEGTFKLFDLQKALAICLEEDITTKMIVEQGQDRFGKLLEVDKTGLVKGTLNTKLAHVLSIPVGQGGLGSFFELLRGAGLKLPTAGLMLGGPSVGANDESPVFGKYRIDSITIPELTAFLGYVSGKIDYVSASNLPLLVTARRDVHGTGYFSIEGALLGFEKVKNV